LRLRIDLSTMANSDHVNSSTGVIQPVEYPVVADSESVKSLETWIEKRKMPDHLCVLSQPFEPAF